MKFYALAAVALGMLATAHAEDPVYRVVARSGTAAPGITNATLADIIAATINERGDVVFTAALTGAGAPVNQRSAIFGDFGAGAQLLVRAGDPAPGTIGANFSSFYIPTLNDQGNLLFSAVLVGPSVVSGNDTGLWQRLGTSTTLVAREGDVIPLGSGFLFPQFTYSNGELANYVFNDSNTAILFGRLSGSSVDYLLWNGSLSSLVKDGDPAPGVPGATLLESGLLVYGGLSDAGRNILSASMTGGGVTTATNTALWMRSPTGQYELLVREGESAPGGPVAQAFGNLSGASYDNFFAAIGTAATGHALFPAFVGSSSALFRGTRGNLTRIAGNGVAVPDVPNTTFDDLGPAVINAHGQVAYAALLVGPPITAANDFGIWSDVSGSFRLIFRQGDFAPSAGGALFNAFTNLLLSDSGQIAATASLSGGGITANNDLGLWMTDASGQLRLVIREGQSFELTPGVNKTVRYFGLVDEDDFLSDPTAIAYTSQTGGPRALNDRGELALIVEFTDGSRALIVATLPPSLPCPADLTVDGFVDDSDFVLFARQYVAFDCAAPTMTDACSADFNDDGLVDDFDFVLFAQAYELFNCP